jgi:2'-5' RNA ligase
MHLTLKFLGATPEGHLPALSTALQGAVPAAPGFELQLGRAGAFEDRRAPRVILATLAGPTKPLLELAARIETWLAAAGWPREKRSFHPHLTLARLPDTLDDSSRRAMAAITANCPVPVVPDWDVQSVSLVRSHLGPQGARYETLAAFPSV